MCNFSCFPVLAAVLHPAFPLQENIVPIGLGFNPVHMSRYEYVEKWDKTCRQVYMDLDTASRAEREDGQDRTAYLINPVVGPEAIAGEPLTCCCCC